jgi:hypothetical protein
MDATGEHYHEWSYPVTEGQKSHILTHMWNTDLIKDQQNWKTGHTKGGHMQEG